jgi:hypothetical protein
MSWQDTFTKTSMPTVRLLENGDVALETKNERIYVVERERFCSWMLRRGMHQELDALEVAAHMRKERT